MVWDKLDDYQRDAVEFVISRPSSALFFEQGTGKTWITAGVIERLMSPTSQFLVIVPLTNKDSTWIRLLSEMSGLSVFDSWDAFSAAGGARALVTHYEAVPAILKRLRRATWDLIVYDEAQRLKSRSSGQSRTAAKLSSSGNRRLILSGTPIEQNPKDLWAQLRFAAPEILGTRWADFEDKFLEPIDVDLKGLNPRSLKFQRALREIQIKKRKRKFRQEMMPEFLSLISPVALRVTKDVLDLPPLEEIRVPVKLRGKQREVYEAIERDLIVQIGDSSISAPLRVTQLGKIQQVCGGYLIDDDGRTHEVGRAKMRKIKSLANHLSKPIVIFCKYREEAAAIHDELLACGHQVATLTGKTKKSLRRELIEQFQAGWIEILVAQIRTGGVGIDLFRAHNAIVYSMTHSFIDYEQMISRLHRRGQQSPVRISLVFAEGTVDEQIYEAILSKRKVAEAVLSQLRGEDYAEGKG